MFGDKKKEINAMIEAARKQMENQMAEAIRIIHESELRMKELVDEVSVMKKAIDETLGILRNEQPEVGKVVDLAEKLESLSKRIDNLEEMVHDVPVMGGVGFMPPAESEHAEMHYF